MLRGGGGDAEFSEIRQTTLPIGAGDWCDNWATLSVEVREAVGNLEAMGFTDREANLAMLGKHGNNVELMLNELLA